MPVDPVVEALRVKNRQVWDTAPDGSPLIETYDQISPDILTEAQRIVSQDTANWLLNRQEPPAPSWQEESAPSYVPGSLFEALQSAPTAQGTLDTLGGIGNAGLSLANSMFGIDASRELYKAWQQGNPEAMIGPGIDLAMTGPPGGDDLFRILGPALGGIVASGEKLSNLTKNAGRIEFKNIDPMIPEELPWSIGSAKAKAKPYVDPESKIRIPTPEVADELLKIEPSYSDSIWKRVKGDKVAEEILEWHNSAAGNAKSAIHANQKTGLSVDFSTSCPKKCSGVGPCIYCYVEHPRVANAQKELGKREKGASTGGKVFSENPYRGELKLWPDSLVKALNEDGGLRMFSFGDFRPGVDDSSVKALLDDAQAKGLYIKAITKEPELLHRFGNHPNLRVNITTDMVPVELSRGVRMDEAKALREKYPNSRIRGVALNREEAIAQAADPNIDVVTLYHGDTNFDSSGKRHDRLFNIIMDQNPDAAKRMGGEDNLRAYLDTFENIGSPNSNFRKELLKEYGPKICCGGGKCSRDPTKCGFNGAVTGAVIAGVSLPWIGSGDD